MEIAHIMKWNTISISAILAPKSETLKLQRGCGPILQFFVLVPIRDLIGREKYEIESREQPPESCQLTTNNGFTTSDAILLHNTTNLLLTPPMG